MKKIIRNLASLKLAVVIMASLTLLIAIGTFVEADFNAEVAQKWIYKTPWMFSIMGALAISLTAVMIDRWPWKRKHISFILAHIGILFLLLGSVVTMVWGIDGSMSLGIGQKNRFVQVPETELVVWSSFDGDRYTQFLKRDVDFLKDPPTESRPYKYALGPGDLEILQYWPFAVSSKKVQSSDGPLAGPALRFQIQNAKVNVNEWLVAKKQKGNGTSVASHNFGPAEVHLGLPPKVGTLKNEVYFHPISDEKLEYTIFYKDPSRKTQKGIVKEGDAFQTGWMGLEVRILRFLPQAEEKWTFEKRERPTPLTTAAIEFKFKEQKYWMQVDDLVKLFTDDAVYIVSYARKRLDLGFDLKLQDFQMGLYQGTTRAMSYQSIVNVSELADPQTISMNEPLKYKGLTFYQASFTNGPEGKPVASILSVNHDPGRFLKYLGSLILSLGIVWLFYDKRKSASALAIKMQKGTSV